MPRKMKKKKTPEETELVSSQLNLVYSAARDGMATSLLTILDKSEPEQLHKLVQRKVLQGDGQCCSPLIIAARYGHGEVVKILLEKYDADVEQEGCVKFAGQMIEGASALWCAAAGGHSDVVKTLVEAGANVNHPTKTGSTPLRAASFSGKLDIVKYLTNHSADIHIPNKYKNTCLMIAAYKGHLDVVNFLLKNEADPNESAQRGDTALHYAAECGHRKIITELLNHGAKMLKNNENMTPLITAAEKAQAEAVECIMEHENVSVEDTIDAYELLGASFGTGKDHRCLQKSYTYLHKAMTLRFRDPKNVIRKTICEPIKAYQNWRESETLERLESISDNQDALHMESLVILERILGQQNLEVAGSIICLGAFFADNAKFNKGADLWLHALHLQQMNNSALSKHLPKFAQLFSQMVHVGAELKFSQVLDVLEASVTELARSKEKLSKSGSDGCTDHSIKDEIESNIMTTLYILVISTKLMSLEETKHDEVYIRRFHHLVRKSCALKLVMKDGQTLLHLAVNAETPVDTFHTNDVCKFPSAATIKLLIQCGADVNAMDNKRNTPLHLIVQNEKRISDFTTLHSTILDLIDGGAHMDCVNSRGHTPFDAAATGVVKTILQTQTKLSLKCMAARAVNEYNLSYKGNVPRSLESFIKLHGTGVNQGSGIR